jgi:chromosome segregation ATPase
MVFNIITLVIVACFLVIYRLTDKSFRSVEKVKRFADKCKEEIAAFVEEKSTAVRNFGIDLDVERKAAAQFMKDIQKLTEEELAKKSQAITKIEGHIHAYESSLEELFEMTDRVQENLNRIRDESAFVESTNRRVGEAKDRFEHYSKALAAAEKTLHETESRLEKKNAEILEKTAGEILVSVKSRVSDFEAAAQVIGRKVEDHREAIAKAERERGINLANDIEQTKKQLKDILENAGKRADKIEEAALVKLREQAQERITQIKTFFEEKIKNTQDTLKNEHADINDKIKTVFDKCNTEINDISTRQKNMQNEWKNLNKETEQNILAANEKRLDEFSKSHAEAFKQLNSLADDAAKLDSELRISMQNVITRIKDDFSVFEKESGTNMESIATAFGSQIQVLQKELEQMNKELDSIKEQASNNVSEKLTAFENEFTAELGKRASEVGRQIADWQVGLQERFANSEDKIVNDLQLTEERLTSEQRKSISAISDRLISDLERLKQEASAFEMGIREEMRCVDETRASFANQLKHDLAEMRTFAENEVKTQIGQYQISMQEILRQKQRELEKNLEEISAFCDNEYAGLEEKSRTIQQTLDEWQSQYTARMREMDASLEKLGRNSREIASDNDERVSMFRQNLEEIRKELGVQKKIFDQTGDLKLEMDRRIEETNDNLNRLEQRKNEIAGLESQLNHVKRLEDEVNNKMTRFLSENRRIELMEESFNRLLRTNAEVEEKLKSISSSNDILQTEQVKIRKLETALKETDEKYQRIEKKNEILEETSDGIDRNFKSLQKTETAIKNADRVINSLSDQFDRLNASIEALSAENERATDAVDKITVLEDSLALIEKRITDMNIAREWLANSETRLTELNKEAKEYVKLAKSLFEKEKGKIKDKDDGAPPPQHRDNIRRLHEQGWTVDEIAKAMGRSIGEIELTLEIITRG